jgi:hypothetical protein
VHLVFELNCDFQGFECVDEKMRLMGYHDRQEEKEMDPHAKWNIFLDVPMRSGK